jgi:hypothetical protein
MYKALGSKERERKRERERLGSCYVAQVALNSWTQAILPQPPHLPISWDYRQAPLCWLNIVFLIRCVGKNNIEMIILVHMAFSHLIISLRKISRTETPKSKSFVHIFKKPFDSQF